MRYITHLVIYTLHASQQHTDLPRFIIQRIASTQVAEDLIILGYGEGQSEQTVELFRVTARGTGGIDNTEVVLQSMRPCR